MGMVDYLDYTYWMVYLQFLKYENENYLYPSLKVFDSINHTDVDSINHTDTDVKGISSKT